MKLNSVFLLALLGILWLTDRSDAQQIVPDTTLGVNSSQLIPFGPLDLILGGLESDSNLFHSFESFGIAPGRAATFVIQNPVIANVLARVTGNERSEIFGVLGTSDFFNGGAPANVNLFLLNPNGILFGPGGRLNLGRGSRGSFFGTAVDALVWPDGGQFGGLATTEPQALLTIRGTPSAFLSTREGLSPIQVQNGELQVAPGQTIGLLGGKLELVDAFVVAPGGRIELGAIASPGEVTLLPGGEFALPTVLERDDISFAQNTIVAVRGEGGGELTVTARDIDVGAGALLLAGISSDSTDPQNQAGVLELDASQTVTVQGDRSRLLNSLQPGGIGQAGNIEIRTQNLIVRDGAQLNASNSGVGSAGNIDINVADNVLITGEASDGRITGLFSTIERDGRGQGGDIRITAGSLEVSNRAQLIANLRGQGEAGDIDIKVDGEVLFDGLSNNSMIGSAALSRIEGQGIGRGGTVKISAENLRLINEATLSTSVFGEGEAGEIRLLVNEQLLLDSGSSISVGINSTGKGRGGDLKIDAGSVIVRDEASIGANIFGLGNAGDIEINSRGEILLDRRVSLGNSVQRSGIGQGGAIRISADSLTVQNDSEIILYSRGRGDGGNLWIETERDVLFDQSAIFSDVEEGAIGNGGNVDISASNIRLVNGSQFASATQAVGNAGNFQLTAQDTISLDSRNATNDFDLGIFTDVTETGLGDAGEITIVANRVEILGEEAGISSVTAGRGQAGDINITAIDSFSLASGQILSDVFQTGVGDGGAIAITADRLALSSRAVITSETDGLGNAGDLLFSIGDRAVLGEDTLISSSVRNAGRGRSGNIRLSGGDLLLEEGAQMISATAGLGRAGEVQLDLRGTLRLEGSLTDPSGEPGSPSAIASGVTPEAMGQGGDIQISARAVEIIEGGQLLAGTEGRGDGGSILLGSVEKPLESLIIQGVEQTGAFGGISTSTIGGETAGDIVIYADKIRLSDGNVIDARSLIGGDSGSIRMESEILEILSGGQILAISQNTGDSKSIELVATESIQIEGTDSNREKRLSGQNAFSFGRLFSISPESGVFTRSFGTGSAGDIGIETSLLSLADRGQINAESNATRGGNINLELDQGLLLRGESLITATAGKEEGGGDGGNLQILAPFVLGLPGENSDIIANAFSGTGGNIQIDADAILNLSLTSERTFDQLRSNSTNDISASSQFGGSGILNLAGLNVDPSRGTAQLPVVPTSNTEIDSSCSAQVTNRSRFVISGRGGLPINPGEFSIFKLSPPQWMELPTLTTSTYRLEQPAETKIKGKASFPIEASEWKQDEQGLVTLSAVDNPIEQLRWSSSCWSQDRSTRLSQKRSP